MTRKKLYSLTPEHRAQLEPWAQRWIANAMSTKPMDDDDRAACIEAVHGIYAAAKLPPPKHIVFVPSPFVLAFGGGFAAAIWHMAKTGFRPYSATVGATYSATDSATYSATDSATVGATYSATDSATRGATYSATVGATYSATYSATVGATVGATYSATVGATDSATVGATYSATDSATYSATDSATVGATYSATVGATDSATVGATYSATDSATRGATRGATYSATVGATDSATYSATYSATVGATDSATVGATYSATDSATRGATYSATVGATYSATYSATVGATYSATYSLDDWYVVPGNMRAVAEELGVGDFGLQCAAQAYRMWQGGNQWSAWDSFLSFFKDVVGLDLPEYEAYAHWQVLAERSGPRIVHPDFCMISDRPAVLKVDDRNLPHCEDGPFCEWRDGSALFSWRGIRVPAKWILHKAVTPHEALTWRDMEQRRAACEILGWHVILKELNAKTVERDPNPEIGELLKVNIPDIGTEQFLRVRCGTGREFAIPVPPTMKTARQANAWTYGFDNPEDYQLEVRT